MFSKHNIRIKANAPSKCEFGCDITFSSPAARGVHYITCPIRQRVGPNYVLLTPPPPDALHLQIAQGLPVAPAAVPQPKAPAIAPTKTLLKAPKVPATKGKKTAPVPAHATAPAPPAAKGKAAISLHAPASPAPKAPKAPASKGAFGAFVQLTVRG